jgi:hypothetical protein
MPARSSSTEAVLESRLLGPGFETCFPAHFAEGHSPVLAFAVAQKEQVTHPEGSVGEPLGRLGIRVVGVGVAGNEEIRPAVAVDVPDPRSAVPAGGTNPGLGRTLRERAVSVVPQQLVDALGGHVQIDVAVAIEIRGDTTDAADGKTGAGFGGHVTEGAGFVLVQRRGGQATLFAPAGRLDLGVGVDDEQIQPPVVIEVQPAEPTSHHRRGIRRDPPAEGPVFEVDADLMCDVDECGWSLVDGFFGFGRAAACGTKHHHNNEPGGFGRARLDRAGQPASQHPQPSAVSSPKHRSRLHPGAPNR